MWGYIDEAGNIKLPFIYDEANSFGENNWAFVKENGRAKFISAEGTEMLSGNWDECYSEFDEWGLVEVSDEKNDFIINESGKTIFSAEHYYKGRVGYDDEDGRERWMILNKNGEIIDENRAFASVFGDNDWVAVGNWAGLSEDEKHTLYQIEYIDLSGNVKLQVEKNYLYAGYFTEVE